MTNTQCQISKLRVSEGKDLWTGFQAANSRRATTITNPLSAPQMQQIQKLTAEPPDRRARWPDAGQDMTRTGPDPSQCACPRPHSCLCPG